MTLARRLERLRPALSPKELFLLALQQYKTGPKIDVDLSGLTPAQHREYMDYARLVVGFNLTASTFYPLFSWRVDCLSHVLDRAEVLVEAAQQLEEKERLPPANPPRNWRRLKREISVPEFLRGLAREEQESVAPEADGLWLELDALRRLQEEAIEQIGEDPAQPATAAAGESAWKAVDGLRQRLGFKKAPPPDPEVLRQFREYMDAVSGADDLEIPR